MSLCAEVFTPAQISISECIDEIVPEIQEPCG